MFAGPDWTPYQSGNTNAYTYVIPTITDSSTYQWNITSMDLNGPKFVAEPTPDPKPSLSPAIAWLRGRVEETCAAAFADIAA